MDFYNCFSPPRKKNLSKCDRLLPEDRSPNRFSPSSPQKTTKRQFSSDLYNSLINEFHPDVTYIKSSPVKKLQKKSKFTQNEIVKRCFRPINTINISTIPSDFYIHPIDWSPNGVISFCQENSILFVDQKQTKYSWKMPARKPTSCRFSEDGTRLSIGTKDGFFNVADVETEEIIQQMKISDESVAVIRRISPQNAVSSKSPSQTSCFIVGDHCGYITILDTRENKECTKFVAHDQEICNIVPSYYEHTIATGGNDNYVKIWDLRKPGEPLVKYYEHIAAVRGIAFSPTHHDLIVTGGGICDRCLRIWNINSGETLRCVQIGSQICNIVWNERYDTLLTTHGFSQNTIALWTNDLECETCFKIHKNRVLYVSISPNGEQLLTAAPKDCAYIWGIFARKPSLSTQMMFSLR